MRKTENEIKKRRQKLPEKYKKIDTSVNGDADRLSAQHNEVERTKKLLPLRIDVRTVIYVTEDKHNEAYAESYRKKYRLGNPQHVHRPSSKVDISELSSLVNSGMTLKEIAREMRLSRTSVSNYIRKFDLRQKQHGDK